MSPQHIDARRYQGKLAAIQNSEALFNNQNGGNTQMRNQTWGGIAATVLAAVISAGNSASAALVIDLGDIISASGTPAGTPPWLRATITQDGTDSVLIKMEALSLVTTPNIEAVKSWAFNLNPTIPRSELTATEIARTGEFKPNPILVVTSAHGYGGFSFDFDFDFATAGGNINTRFTDGDSVTMKLTRASGLLEADFNYSALHAGREFYSGAHIISLADGKSAFVGATAPTVPEPATIIAGALVLLPLGASTIRILTRKPAA
jgi:hypothetical protein